MPKTQTADHSTRVLRLRLKDKHATWCRARAAEVNFVWNYCNETSRKVLEREQRFISAYELDALTAFMSNSYIHLRREPQSKDLNPQTLAWLDGLPAELRPCETALRFARIANRLAELWATPPLCLQYLDELCFDRRGGRQGFPLGVAAELLALKAYLEPELERCEMAWAFEREEKYDPASLASIEEDLGTILSQPLPQEALPDSLDDSE